MALSRVVESFESLCLRGTNEVHYEVELGFFIGKQAKIVKAEVWHVHVQGYFLGIDFTDRDLQGLAKKNCSPWTLTKFQDRFFTFSGFVDVEKVRNPHDLEISYKINHKFVQR